MSINVTVTGNPVSINRGKMVTTDTYNSKKEFEKRRLMRLEQVRQQSKDIAEEVRNKVRKEKKKCLGEIERQGKENLKCWQNKKLLELQQQYKEALHDIGMGHREAAELDDETEIVKEQREIYEKMAKHRGKVAATKAQIEKNEENMKKAIPLQKKKVARDIENTRSALVSGLKKKNSQVSCKKNCKKRRPSADINITIPSESDSSDDELQNCDNASDMPDILEENEEGSTSSCDCSQDIRLPLTTDRTDPQSNVASNEDKNTVDNTSREVPTCMKATQSFSQMLECQKQTINNFRRATSSSNNQDSEDTRISDRIKRREMLACQPDYCDIAVPVIKIPSVENSTKIQDSISRRESNSRRPAIFLPDTIEELVSRERVSMEDLVKPSPNIQGINDSKKSIDENLKNQNKKVLGGLTESEISKLKKLLASIDDKNDKSGRVSSRESPTKVLKNKEHDIEMISSRQPTEIPSKPPIKLRGLKVKDKLSEKTSKTTGTTVDSNKIQFYDHLSRFGSNKNAPPTVRVEKIDSSSVEVIPNLVSEAEEREKMKQRDKDAQIRGRKALEKEKIHRDYEEMMKKLPMLEKIERIAEIGKDKPEYHMSEDRLKELERKRQNELENIFSREFPNLKPAIVTLPSRNDVNSSKVPPPNLERASENPEESLQTINVAKWDVDYGSPQMFSAQEVREIVNALTGQNSEDRRRKLKELIRSLKSQEEQLLNEIKSLPQDESTKKLVNDLSTFIAENKKRKQEKKRRREENDSSLESISSSDRHIRKHKNKTSSPRKKVKSKKVLVLQNTSTQTTPKALKKPLVESSEQGTTSSENKICDKLDAICDCGKSCKEGDKIPKNICNKLHIPCSCNLKPEETSQSKDATSDELCHILIKINDSNETPEVVVKSKDTEKVISPRKKEKKPEKENQRKEVPAPFPREPQQQFIKPRSISKTTQSKPQLNVQRTQSTNDKKQKPSESKSRSWKEQLSKNSISTTSTSYLSPPDLMGTLRSAIGSTLQTSIVQGNVTNDTRLSFSQSSASNRTIDPRLLNYVKKLLSMSRISIDELAASSSEVPTPNQSVVEMESNNTMAQIQNILKYFHLQAADLAQEISYSDSNHRHNNTSASTSVSGQRQTEKLIPEKDGSSSCSKECLTNKYADITDSCSKRIADLGAMIEKLREDKLKILEQQGISEERKSSPVISDKDYSTKYLDLPGHSDKSEKSKESSKSSSNPSWDDEELTKKLLEVDVSLADKLQRFPTNIEESGESSRSVKNVPEIQQMEWPIDEGEMDSEDREFYQRLKKLRDTGPALELPIEKAAPPAPFVSILDSIPKLPILEALPPESSTSTSNLSSGNTTKRHPPPSKGLVVAKKFNEDIALVPHELSTIIEAESLVSTRITPNASKLSPNKEKEKHLEAVEEKNKSGPSGSSTDRSVPEISPEISVSISKKKKACTEETCPVVKKSVSPKASSTCTDSTCKSKSKKKLISSSSSDDIETIESMLKSIGMEWAIPTLYKTQEALALTSSSSSSDLSKSKTKGSISMSEVSLSDYLRQQLLGRISSSTLNTDASPKSLLEFSNLSAIANNSSAEKANQRTSTPILNSKNSSNANKSERRGMFTEESEISSVKDSGKSSDKFHSLSEHSVSKD